MTQTQAFLVASVGPDILAPVPGIGKYTTEASNTLFLTAAMVVVVVIWGREPSQIPWPEKTNETRPSDIPN